MTASASLTCPQLGTSVDLLQQYYGKQATPKALATTLGRRLKDTRKLKEKQRYCRFPLTVMLPCSG